MTVGVPVSMPPPPQNYNPYPAQQQQGQNPYNPTNPPQGYYPTQNNAFNQGIQQPAVVMINNQRMAVPQIIDYTQPINIRCPCCSLQVTTVVNN